MASSVVAFAFMILCCVTLKATGAGLNEACNASSTCTDTVRLACDTNRDPPVCKVKADEAASCVTTSDCVAGSRCVDNKCACNPNISARNTTNNLCNPVVYRVGGGCNNIGTMCPGNPRSRCLKYGNCTCDEEFEVNYMNYSCEVRLEPSKPCTLDTTVATAKSGGKTTLGVPQGVPQGFTQGVPQGVTQGAPVSKNGSSMLILSTFLVTIVSTLSKMMM